MKKCAPAIFDWADDEPHDGLAGGVAVPDLLRVHVGLGAEDAEADLLLGHFQREEADRAPLADGDVLGDVQREGGLPDRGPRREDDQVGALQARGHPVELREPGRETRQHALPAAGLLDDVQVVAGDLADRLEAAPDRVLGDVEDLAGGVAQQGLGVLLLREPSRTIRWPARISRRSVDFSLTIRA